MDEPDAGRENVGLVCRVVREFRVGSHARELSGLNGSEKWFKIVPADDDQPVPDLDADRGRIGVVPVSATKV